MPEATRRDLFRYLAANDGAEDYLAILDLFTATMLADLSAAEVCEQLVERGIAMDRDTAQDRCNQLVAWGNLVPSIRDTRVTTVAEYLRSRSRYQVSKLGGRVHREARAVMEAASGAREVARELLGQIVDALDRVLAGVAETGRPDAVCDHHDLPADVAALADAVRHLDEVRRACDRLASTCKQLVCRGDQHQSALGEVDTAAERCREAELRAETRRQQWYDLSVEVAAMHDAIDLSVEEATRELERLEQDRRSEQAAIDEAHREHTELRAELSAAHERGRHAGDTVEGAREALTAAARRFNSHLDLPGLVTSVPDAAIPAIDDLGSADAVRTAAQAARTAINRPSQPVDENAVLRAFQIFDREVAGQLDAQYTVTDGVAVIDIGGAGDATTLPGAAASLSEREREVFTADYTQALAAASAGEGLPLEGRAEPTPWDPGLAAAMAERGVAVHEETLISLLLDDLR